MSKTIDQRVVEMQFDNTQFEKNIAQSMSSLSQLKASLNFDNLSIDGLGDLTSGLSGLGSSVDTIAEKFTTWGIMATTAIINITQEILSLVDSIRGSLTENITAGWTKYETLMESVQTIMYATRNEWEDTAEQMDYVTGIIEKLNWYTDETSYNLTDMTSSIGKFVAAGVDLDDAATAMEGISSWAAISGQNAEKASAAMYNLSQAISIGKVTTQDWKSIENANMATTEFKQTAIDTAIELGILEEAFYDVDDATTKYIRGFKDSGEEFEITVENFRTTLQYGWFDSDVLTQTLLKYGDFADQLYDAVNKTGVTTTEFLGYLDEYKEAISNGEDMTSWVEELASEEHITAVTSLGEYLELLSGEYYELGYASFKAAQEAKTFKDATLATKDAISSAWMGIFTAIFGNYLESKELWTQVTEEMYDLFVEDLQVLRRDLESWNRMGGADYLIDAFWNFYYTFKDIITAIKEGFEEVFPDELSRKLLYFVQDLYKLSEKVSLVDWPWYSDFENIKEAATSLAGVLKNFLKNVETIGKAIGSAWNRIFPIEIDPAADSLTETIRDVAASIKDLSDKFVLTSEQGNKLERTFAGLFAVLDIFRMLIVAILDPILGIKVEVGEMDDGILDVTASIGDWLVSLRDWLKENEIFEKAVAQVIEFIQQIPSYADQASRALFGMGIEDLFWKVKDAVVTAFEVIIGLIMDFPGTISEIDQSLQGTEFEEFWETTKKVAQEAWDVIKGVFNWISENGAKAIETITSIDWAQWWSDLKDKVQETWDKIKEFLDSIPGEFDKVSQKLFNKSWSEVFEDAKKTLSDLIPKIKEAYHAVMQFFGLEEWNDPNGKYDADPPYIQFLNKYLPDLQDFADAFDDFLTSDGAKSLRNVAVIAAIIAGLYLIYKIVTSSNSLVKTIETFRSPAENLGPLGFLNQFAEGAKTVQENFGKYVKYAAFKLIADMVLEIAAAIMLIAMIKTEKLIAAVAALTIMMGEIVVLCRLVGNTDTTQLQKTGTAFSLMGGTLLEIAIALALLGTMSWDQILVGATSLTGVLMAMVLAFTILDKNDIIPTVMMNWAAAFVVMGVGIMAIGLALSFMQSLNPGQMIAAATAISMIVLAISGAMVLLTKTEALSNELLYFGGAVALLGVGAAAAGAGVWLICDGILRLSTIGPEGINNLANAVTTFFDLLPGLAVKAAEALISFIDALNNNRQVLVDGLYTIIDMIIVAVAGAIPALLELLDRFLTNLLQLAIDILPKLVQFLQVLFDTLIALTIGWTPRLIDALIFVVRELLRSIAVLTPEITHVAIDILINTVEELLRSMIVLTPQITATALYILLDTLRQLAEHIAEITALVTEIALNILWGTIGGILNSIPEFIEVMAEGIINIINGLADTIRNNTDPFIDAITNLVDAVITAFCKMLGINSPSTVFMDYGAYIVKGLLNGLANNLYMISNWFTNLVSKIMTIVNSILEKVRAWGTNVINKMKEGIDAVQDIIQNTIEWIINGVINFIYGALDFFGYLGRSIMEFIYNGINEYVIPLIDLIKQPFNDAIDFIWDTIDYFKTLGNSLFIMLYNGIIEYVGPVLDLIKSPLNDAKDFLWDCYDSFWSLGKNVMVGLYNGATSYAQNIINKVRGTVQTAIDAAKNLLGISSPSKVFYEIGRFMDEGFSNGIEAYTGQVGNSSEEMAQTAVDSVSTAIANISDLVDSELTDPTIKPVLDLTDIVNGANAIDDMLSGDNTVNVASRTGAGINNNLAEQESIYSAFDSLRNTLSGISGGESVVNNNTFNITGDDPKAIANEVSNILQRQIERRGAAWA